MTDIHFYHLTQKRLEETLPSLLEKTLERGWRAVVMTGSPERTEALSQYLWTYRQDAFLPHGTAKDGHAAAQPIWITEKDERPNDAAVLFLTDGASSASLADYDRVCEIFDGASEEAVAAARLRFKQYKTDGHTLTYWQQSEKGWEKAA
jgi:DNA polymerase III subunit chi